MDYTEQIKSAIQYINDHWNEDISVNDVAASVHMSPFHFHRVFSAVMGMTLFRYVRLRRLQYAAQELRRSKRSIADIALECQFESQATFTRAFVHHTGTPPGQYRRDPKRVDRLFLPNVVAPEGREDKENMEVAKIIHSPALDLVGLVREDLDAVNDNGQAILGLWDEFYRRVLEPDEDVPTYGVCFGGTGTTFSYMAAVQRKGLRNVPDNIVSRHVAEHQYAVFRHDEAAGPISEAFREIWTTGLAATGKEYAEGSPDLEVYPGRSWSKQVVLEIWIPIR